MMTKQQILDSSSAELTDIIIQKQREVSELKQEIDAMKGELQTRGLQVLDERNQKFIEFFGENAGIASVTIAQKMEILNYFRLKELLGAEFTEEKIKRMPSDIKYDVDSKFNQALIALVTSDYEADTTLDEALCGLDATQTQKELIKKKLKGDYKKDRKVLSDILKIDERELSYDTELFFIGKIKNYQLICTYFDENRLNEIKEELKKCVAVDETVKIAAKSIKEDNVA
ncbi:MAG: hypothetical protein K2N34_15490 [Lachnospiraceae bacterium]|nr:hypothetical protein [Lachnospiraceae bacterium]